MRRDTRRDTQMGYTPLHLACIRENKELILLLIERGSDLDAVGAVRRRARVWDDVLTVGCAPCAQSGFTPLHLVCQSDAAFSCVDELLRLGANTQLYDEVHTARGRGLSISEYATHFGNGNGRARGAEGSRAARSASGCPRISRKSAARSRRWHGCTSQSRQPVL